MNLRTTTLKYFFIRWTGSSSLTRLACHLYIQIIINLSVYVWFRIFSRPDVSGVYFGYYWSTLRDFFRRRLFSWFSPPASGVTSSTGPAGRGLFILCLHLAWGRGFNRSREGLMITSGGYAESISRRPKANPAVAQAANQKRRQSHPITEGGLLGKAR